MGSFCLVWLQAGGRRSFLKRRDSKDQAAQEELVQDRKSRDVQSPRGTFLIFLQIQIPPCQFYRILYCQKFSN